MHKESIFKYFSFSARTKQYPAARTNQAPAYLGGLMSLFIWAPLIVLLPASLKADGDNSSYCEIAKSAMIDASRIRGLKVKKQVPCLVHDKGDVKEYLLHTIATKLPPGKLKMEGMVYKALGIVPDKFDYEHGLVDLYLNQIGGYYDAERKHFIMAAWMPAMLQTTVAVHELTHGLQDQYFDLDAIMDPHTDNSDMMLARSALVEGDANSVMLDQARERAGQKPISEEPDVDTFMLQNIVGLSLMGMGDIPGSLQMIMLFPYTSGMRFVHGLLHNHGYREVDKAFSRLPRSTEEILHPEKYLVEKPDFVTISSDQIKPAALSKDSKVLYEDTVGEFTISALLSNYAKDKRHSTIAAAGWGGDRVALFEDGGKKLIVWKTVWDSERDAEEFYEQYAASLLQRFSNLSEEKIRGGEFETDRGQKVFFKKVGPVVNLTISLF